MKLIQVDFHHAGPFGAEHARRVRERAESIAGESGLIWKIWTENEETQRAGGVYLFADEASASAYLARHRERLSAAGATDIQGQLFDVNESLSAITYAPLSRA